MIRGYKYRIYPTEEQKNYFAQCFGANRWWWNYCLKKIEDNYQEYKAMKENGEDVSKYQFITPKQLSKNCTSLKKEEPYLWLNNVNASSLVNTCYGTLGAVFKAYKDFRKNGKGKPKYKRKENSDSFTYQIQKKNIINGKQKGTIINWKDSTIEVPKIGNVKIVIHRTFNGTIKAATISRQAYDYYEISLLVDDNICELDKKEPTYEGTVGIDLGIKDNAILSNGKKFDTFKISNKVEEKIKRLQRKLSKKELQDTGETKFSKKWNKEVPIKKPSKNYIKVQEKLAKLKAKEKRQRTYNAHQITSYVTKNNNFDTICLEDLNVKGMSKNHHVAKAVTNANMYRIKTQLEYKSKWLGKNVVTIGRFEPSSQVCNCCGFRNKKLKNLSIREWTCPKCGAKHDRDINAANNIRDWGYKKITEGKQ